MTIVLFVAQGLDLLNLKLHILQNLICENYFYSFVWGRYNSTLPYIWFVIIFTADTLFRNKNKTMRPLYKASFAVVILTLISEFLAGNFPYLRIQVIDLRIVFLVANVVVLSIFATKTKDKLEETSESLWRPKWAFGVGLGCLWFFAFGLIGARF